jgi:uncharacterized protein (TIGR03382 family)
MRFAKLLYTCSAFALTFGLGAARADVWSTRHTGANATFATHLLSDGSVELPAMRYFATPQVFQSAGLTSLENQFWDLDSTATTAGTFTLSYSFIGFHAYSGVTAKVWLVVNDVETILVDAGPASCCTAPSAGFNYRGSTPITLEVGDTYGFRFGGLNSDSNHTMHGWFSAQLTTAADNDDDAVAIASDNCPLVKNPGQGDADADGIGDACDSCPFSLDAPYADLDDDGLGDACDSTNDKDFDGDGVDNVTDNCAFVMNNTQGDSDADGLGDACDTHNDADFDTDGIDNITDNCPFDPNSIQTDSDADGIGDACDTTDGTDVDGDAIANTDDNCPFVTNDSQADADADGLGDECDPTNGLDLDGDSVANADDNCPFATNAAQADADGDGIGDDCDAHDGDDSDGGCSASGHSSGSALFVVLCAGLVIGRRRRHRR